MATRKIGSRILVEHKSTDANRAARAGLLQLKANSKVAVTVIGPVLDAKMLSSSLASNRGFSVEAGTAGEAVLKRAIETVRGGTDGEFVKHMSDPELGVLITRHSPEVAKFAATNDEVAAAGYIPFKFNAVDAAISHLQNELGAAPLAGKRFAVVTGHDFIPSELREYSLMLRGLGAQVDFVTDGPKTLHSDLNGGNEIQQLTIAKDIGEVTKNLDKYSGVIVGANYTSKNQSGGDLKTNPLFNLVDKVMQRGDIALGLNCHALWALMGAKAVSGTPDAYENLDLTFNTVLEPEARALGIADARPANRDMHHFAVTDQAHHIVSSSAGVETGTIRLVEQMAKEVVRMQDGGGAGVAQSAFEPATAKGPAELQPKGLTPVTGSLALGKEERQFQKGPAVNDPRHFDAPLDGAGVDAVVAAVRKRTGSDEPLKGKKVAIVVESLFDATELREYAHVLNALGAQVVYTSRRSFPGWVKTSQGWPDWSTFESAATPKSDKVHQLQVEMDLVDVEANIGEYAAIIIPDGNGSKRLSYRPDGQAFEDNPFFKVVSAALGNPGTKVAVRGRGMWGLLGAATLPGSPLNGATLVPSAEMRPEALAIADVVGGRVGELAPGAAQQKLLFDAGRGSLALVEELANQLTAK